MSYLQKIVENSTLYGDFIIWHKSLSTSGYSQMRLCSPEINSQRFLDNRIVFEFNHNVILDNQQLDVSNICHRKDYVYHLIYEPKYVNAQRRSCVLLQRCYGHAPFNHACSHRRRHTHNGQHPIRECRLLDMPC